MKKARIYAGFFLTQNANTYHITKGKDMEKGKDLELKVKNLINSNNPRYKVTYTTITEDSYQVKITHFIKLVQSVKKNLVLIL